MVPLNVAMELADEFGSRRQDLGRTEAGTMHFTEKRTCQDLGDLFRVMVSQPVHTGLLLGAFLQQRQLGEA